MPPTETKDTLLESGIDASTLDRTRLEIVDAFVQIARLVGQPRSVGQIYGYLFTCQEPVPMDEVMDSLGISKGSASQGLRLLRDVGAIRAVYVNGDRRDHYLAEVSLKKLLRGYLEREIRPHIESGGERLTRMTQALLDGPVPADQEFLSTRIAHLGKWHKRASSILPLLVRLAK